MSFFEAFRNLVSPAKKPIRQFKPSEKSLKKVGLSDGLRVKDSRIIKHVSSSKSKSMPSTSAKYRTRFLSLLPSIISKQKDSYDDSIVSPSGDFDGSTVVSGKSSENSPSKDSEAALIEDEESGQGKKVGENNVCPADSSATKPVMGNVVKYKGWSEDEIWLFERLDNRGFEPLLPLRWAYDFPNLYDCMYARDDAKALINSVSGRTYHACKELDGLFMLGSRARDRLLANLPPEGVIRRQLQSYYEWTMLDADLKSINALPAISIATATPNESVSSVVHRMTNQLHEIGSQYRARWIDKERSNEIEQHYVHDLPTLYGIIIKQAVFSIVTHDTIYPEQEVKCIGVYNFKDESQDVWHGLALSIVFIRARNDLLTLKAEGEYEPQPESLSITEDPDA